MIRTLNHDSTKSSPNEYSEFRAVNDRNRYLAGAGIGQSGKLVGAEGQDVLPDFCISIIYKLTQLYA